jgi:hypothetical protein
MRSKEFLTAYSFGVPLGEERGGVTGVADGIQNREIGKEITSRKLVVRIGAGDKGPGRWVTYNQAWWTRGGEC